ncbi:hypothetical protein V1509DRAFT_674226 [Lipomyces kononenkoae]
MRGNNVPSSGIVFIILGVLFLLEHVSAYIHGTLCVSGVFFSYETYLDGSIQSVGEEPGLVVYQQGVDLSQVLGSVDLLTADLRGSAEVTTIFKVGRHTCTLHGQWSAEGGDAAVNQPQVTSITCPGTDRDWIITSADPKYTSLVTVGNLNPPNPEEFGVSFFNMYGLYCGSY